MNGFELNVAKHFKETVDKNTHAQALAQAHNNPFSYLAVDSTS